MHTYIHVLFHSIIFCLNGIEYEICQSYKSDNVKQRHIINAKTTYYITNTLLRAMQYMTPSHKSKQTKLNQTKEF
jgi:hypothetical protein